jgi:hypothetical protein
MSSILQTHHWPFFPAPELSESIVMTPLLPARFWRELDIQTIKRVTTAQRISE